MSNIKPLQAGDRLQTSGSGVVNSDAADRRSQDVVSIHSYEGTNDAPSRGEPQASQLYKCGYINPSSFLTAPFNPVLSEGDTSGEGTKCYEVEIDSYGDSYDPTAPIRVRQADQWTMDSDHDGKLN